MATTAKIRLYDDTKKTQLTGGSKVRLYNSPPPVSKAFVGPPKPPPPVLNKFGLDVSGHVMNPLNPNNQLNQQVEKVNVLAETFKPKNLLGGAKTVGDYLYNQTGQILAPGITPEELRDKQILKDTLLGLPRAAGKIIKQTVSHPLDTAVDVVSGAAKGISDVISNAVINIFVPKADREFTRLQVEETLMKYLGGANVDPNSVRGSIKEGFHAGGSAAPFIAAGGIGGEFGVALGRATTPFAEAVSSGVGTTLGFVGAGQTQVPIEATVKERSTQLMHDLVGLGLFMAGSKVFETVKGKATTAIRESLKPKVETKTESFREQPKGSDIVPEKRTTEVAKTVEVKSEVPRTFESPKEISTPKTEFQSRVFQRLQAENPVLEGDLSYNPIKLKEDAARATELIAKDKQKAYDIAMGKEKSADITSTAVNITLAEKALSDGNTALYAKLVKTRSLEQTRRGQEIVSEKGSVKDNSTARYVKELISTRLEKLGKEFLSDITDKFNKKSNKERAMAKIDTEVTKLEKRIKNKKLDTKTALDLLDKLTCLV